VLVVEALVIDAASRSFIPLFRLPAASNVAAGRDVFNPSGRRTDTWWGLLCVDVTHPVVVVSCQQTASARQLACQPWRIQTHMPPRLKIRKIGFNPVVHPGVSTAGG